MIMAKSMRDVSINLAIVFLITSVVLIFDTLIVSCSAGNNSHHVLCVESERQALLRFKQDLIDPSNRLFSWGTGESAEGGDCCCEWVGVVCNNLTGNVQELHLQNSLGYDDEAYKRSQLGGKLNPSLLDLKHLSYLDLSCNNFDGIQIPSFIGSFGSSLRYLNLSYAGFGGVIPTQLGNLSNLHSLHLNGKFTGVIPHQLGNLSNLHSLDLHGNFTGVIPHQLGNLSNLHYLILQGYGYLYAETLQWLSGNSLLELLDLSWVNLSKASDHWLQVTNMLPSLVELHLVFCELDHFPPLHVHAVNFTSLAFLDLSNNRFESVIPDWLLSLSGLHHLDLGTCDLHEPIPSALQNFTSLTHLDLSSNLFNSAIPEWLSSFNHLEFLDLSYNGFTEGRLPRSFGNLCSLKELWLSSVQLGGDILEVIDILSRCILDELDTLRLSNNQLSGHFPDVVNQLAQSKKLVDLCLSNNSLSGQVPLSLGRLSSLEYLDLSNNNLSGPLPESLGQLANLEVLSMSRNSLKGVISEVHFANLTRLSYFYGSRNQLFLNVSPNWVPKFQLREFLFRSCRLGERFPYWLQSQKILGHLDISDTGISGIIPRFWNLSSQIYYLNMSHNYIHGEIVNNFLSITDPLSIIDLSSNHFNSSLPRFSSNVLAVDLSNNSFSGSISHFLCYKMHESKNLELLNLERNHLSGELPNCWASWFRLKFINLNNNNLSGKIPSSMGSLNSLKSLHLRNNSLSEIPPSLQSCTRLVAIDFGENKFSGRIPTWIGERLPNLKILILRSNKFHSYIPKKLCALSSLQILDFAHNNFSGTIPACFMNLSAITIKQNSSDQMLYMPDSYIVNTIEGFLENVELMIKGQMAGYSTILQLVTSMDLSDNSLSGDIPKELMSLRGLRSLNLSNNLLTGRIPENIGVMELLESIDFSMNHLSGGIPPSMSSLTFLNHLNLSYNNLIGKIPSSTQLQSFDTMSFLGNSLCGPPLTDSCGKNDVRPTIENGGRKKGIGIEIDWFYVSMTLGFVVGFWGIVGPFLFNKAWRFVCFRLMDNMWYKFCDFTCMC